MSIKIVDLFAGPGGLGEGFSSFGNGNVFKILVSAEMDTSAHATLRLRSFFRLIRNEAHLVRDYYAFCNGAAAIPFTANTKAAWEESGNEAKLLTLGDEKDNAILDKILDNHLVDNEPWVLIGGPPCQAYSIVGRSRNAGKLTYKAEDDHRHFLYKEYLRIIRDRRPPVFVMENVKGILSARVSENLIFHEILKDLADPDRHLDNAGIRPGYRIHSLVSDTFYERGMDVTTIDPKQFVIKAEDHGIPQARHRVILIGIRINQPQEGQCQTIEKLALLQKVSVRDVISDLPPLRSTITKVPDSNLEWEFTVKRHLVELAADATTNKLVPLAERLTHIEQTVRINLSAGGLRVPRDRYIKNALVNKDWYLDNNLKFWLNHEARGHMLSDLRRYAFAATYAELNKLTPVGHQGFSLDGLAPNHKNWTSGKFSDRFRVQRYDSPATTVTSHIAKDGHYFIHPDPTQCRSLTVREAARLQTFPDNYFFQGNRTQQFHQVGNAVPPRLAYLIAEKVSELFQT